MTVDCRAKVESGSGATANHQEREGRQYPIFNLCQTNLPALKRILIILGISIIIAFLLVMFGSGDWIGRLKGWPVYQDWIISTLSAFIVLLYFDFMDSRLNRKYPWLDNWRLRLALQFSFLVVIPMGLAVLITWVQYTFLYDQTLAGTGYFQNEFLVTLLIVGLVNIGYFTVYLLTQYRQVDTTTSNNISAEVKADEMVLIAQKGSQQVPVQLENIAYIRIQSRILFLTSFDDTTLILQENLDHYEQLLPRDSFFRANRQMIVHRKACRAYKSIENGKIKVELTPGEGKNAIISQKKASRFREWIRKSPGA